MAIKDGSTRIQGSLMEKNTGVANGRLHVMTDTHDHIAHVATNNKFMEGSLD